MRFPVIQRCWGRSSHFVAATRGRGFAAKASSIVAEARRWQQAAKPPLLPDGELSPLMIE